MSFLWDTIKSWWDTLLQSLGLVNKSGTLLVLGLDNAGKTTLLYRLRTGGDIQSFPPTDRPQLQHFTLSTGGAVTSSSKIQFTAWDLGGHEAVRYLWEDYISEKVNAILFLIDATDTERIEEAAYELDALLCGGSPNDQKLLAGIPMALLLNKCDVTELALTTEEICQRIEYDRLYKEHVVGSGTTNHDTTSDGGQLSVFRISVLNGYGYDDAFRWISQFL